MSNILMKGTEPIGQFSETIESGSNTDGSWIKYSDGTMICNKSVAVRNLAVSTAWGNIYESDLINLGDLPQEFYSTPIVTASVINGNAWLEALPLSDNKTLGSTRLVRPTIATINADIHIIAIGRWKA